MEKRLVTLLHDNADTLIQCRRHGRRDGGRVKDKIFQPMTLGGTFPKDK